MNSSVKLEKGDSIDVTLVSGRIINIECTQDTADIVCDDRVLFSEDFNYGDLTGPAGWAETHPHNDRAECDDCSNSPACAFFNARSAFPDSSRCNAFSARADKLACAVAAVLPDVAAGIRFAELCNELESMDCAEIDQIAGLTEFLALTVNDA